MKDCRYTGSIIAGMALVSLGIWFMTPAQPLVRGRVTLDGEPLGNAFVFYQSEQDPPSNLSRFTRTDATGQYEFDQTDSPPPGKYRVIIKAAGGSGEFATLDDSVQRETMAAAKGDSHRHEVPVVYRSPVDGGLTVDIDDTGLDYSELLLFSGYRTATADQTSQHR